MSNVIEFKRPKPRDESEDRIEKIKTSLEKINKLMAELKQISSEGKL